MTEDRQWHLRRISARNFLGIGPAGIELELDKPVVVLNGPNGAGKSTVLSAIEWALFGELRFSDALDVDDLKGAGYDRHRIYLHRGQDDAEVELEFACDEETGIWTRVRDTASPKPDDDEVRFVVDGEPIEVDLDSPLGLSQDLFSRCVAPRQDNLAVLVRAEGTERNRMLDRMLGIGHLSSLTKGLSSAKRTIRRRLGDVEASLESVHDDLRSRVRQAFDLRRTARDDAVEAGAGKEKLSLEGAWGLAEELCQQLDQDLPQEETVDDLSECHDRLDRAAAAVWKNPGPRDRLERLRGFRDELKRTRKELHKALSTREGAQSGLKEVRDEFGSFEEVTEQLAALRSSREEIRDDLSTANQHASVLSRTKEWLALHSDEDELDCPACAREIEREELAETVQYTLDRLSGDDSAIEALTSQEEDLSSQIDDLDKARTSLEEARSQKEDADEDLARAMEGMRSVFNGSLSGWPDQADSETEQNVLEACEAAWELLQEHDLPAADQLDSHLRHITEELGAAIDQTESEIEAADEEVRGQREKVELLRKLVRFLEADEELAAFDEALADDSLSEARQELQAARGRMRAVEALAEAAGQVAVLQAQTRIDSLEPRLAEWFERLTEHDALTTAAIATDVSRTGGTVKVTYRLRACDEEKDWQAAPGPALSGGYQKMLGVAAICALAEERGADDTPGILGFDELDGLDPDLRRKVLSALGTSSPAPTTILTTTDRRDIEPFLEAAGANRTRVVTFEPWTAERGVRLEGDS